MVERVPTDNLEIIYVYHLNNSEGCCIEEPLSFSLEAGKKANSCIRNDKLFPNSYSIQV